MIIKQIDNRGDVKYKGKSKRIRFMGVVRGEKRDCIDYFRDGNAICI